MNLDHYPLDCFMTAKEVGFSPSKTPFSSPRFLLAAQTRAKVAAKECGGTGPTRQDSSRHRTSVRIV